MTALDVSILPEPVERPLDRFLHKRDRHYNRVVPDWTLQYKTVEQQYLYEGDFSVFVREITEEGIVVQDAVTGVFGFIHQAEGDEPAPAPAPAIGTLLPSVKCTHIDTTVVMSPDVSCLRLQTGVVFEWDEQVGEGYILPTEGQDARRMIRVLRRDVRWHDSRRLFVGQFVQFETALPGEVPIGANDEPLAPFALRVRPPELHFALRPEAAGAAGAAGAAALAPRAPARRPLAPASGRPGARGARHPVLQRWADAPAAAESPAWLWAPALAARALGEHGARAPVLPLQLLPPLRPRERVRILTHEVATQRGDLWREPAQRRGARARELQKPPSRKKQQQMSLAEEARRDRAQRREMRRWKLRAAGQRRS